MSREGNPTTNPPGCPASESLAEYIDNAMNSADHRAVEEHLVGCSDCRAVVAEASLTRNAIHDANDSVRTATLIRFPSRWKWTGAVALLAAAAVMVMAIRSMRPSERLESQAVLDPKS